MAPGIRLDGRMDEPQWTAADSIRGFAQVEPVERGEPSYRTVVKVLASPDALVIGIRAYDDPDGIVSFARAPDADLRSQDHVRVVLDTFLDGRTGYVFAVNPTGARYDALVAGQGESENASWDGIWEAAVRREADGWTAELRIPVRSLIFEPGLERWGFNVERRIQRLQETDRWASPGRDFRVTQVARAGYLMGLPDFRLGLGLSVRPALTTGGGYPAPDTTVDGTLHPSLDVTQRVGSNLLASLTLNTDFAETEVDTRRTNLTRFPLFFPEKRTFFLEGSDIFDFGLGLGDDVMPFFSRRIGLVSGSTVPLRLGGKLSGRVGGTSIGGLVAQTGTAPGGESPGPMGVVRLKQNVLSESSVGMIASFGDPLGRQVAWTAGVDGTYQTSRLFGDRNFLVGAWGLLDGRGDLAGDGRDRTAFGLSIDYPNDLWDVYAGYKRLGEGFDPSLGFVPRPAVQLADLNVELRPRPELLGIRQCFWENRASWVAGLDGVWQSWRFFMAPINCRFESGDRVEFNWVPEGERLAEPFEVAEGVAIPGYTAPGRAGRCVETVSAVQPGAQRGARRGPAAGGLLHGRRGRAPRQRQRVAGPPGRQLRAVRLREPVARHQYPGTLALLAHGRPVRGLQPQHPRPAGPLGLRVQPAPREGAVRVPVLKTGSLSLNRRRSDPAPPGAPGRGPPPAPCSSSAAWRSGGAVGVAIQGDGHRWTPAVSHRLGDLRRNDDAVVFFVLPRRMRVRNVWPMLSSGVMGSVGVRRNEGSRCRCSASGCRAARTSPRPPDRRAGPASSPARTAGASRGRAGRGAPPGASGS